jgi:hypothetical protein
MLATTSNFLADIQSGFLIPSSKSTIKFSGTTFNISLFGISTQLFALSIALSISSSDTSDPEIDIIHLLFMTSKLEELKEIYAQVTCSQAILSASSKEESRLVLNSSISRMFHFLIAVEFEIPTHNMLNHPSFSSPKYPIIVLILELHISMVVIALYTDIYSS